MTALPLASIACDMENVDFIFFVYIVSKTGFQHLKESRCHEMKNNRQEN